MAEQHRTVSGRQKCHMVKRCKGGLGHNINNCTNGTGRCNWHIVDHHSGGSGHDAETCRGGTGRPNCCILEQCRDGTGRDLMTCTGGSGHAMKKCRGGSGQCSDRLHLARRQNYVRPGTASYGPMTVRQETILQRFIVFLQMTPHSLQLYRPVTYALSLWLHPIHR